MLNSAGKSNPLIKNYGLFWKREEVEWVPRQGKLRGIGVRKKRQGYADFSKQRRIYALYDETFRLIYVGQAGKGNRRLYNRLRAHTRNNLAHRWTYFSWFGVCKLSEERDEDDDFVLEEFEGQPVGLGDTLNHLEAILIMAGEPIRNQEGGRFGDGVIHYRQLPLDHENMSDEDEYDDE
jgi:hypothetical protein